MDTLKISSKLNSLSSAINWVCIDAQIAGQSFYKMEKGNCNSNMIQQAQRIHLPQANNIIVSFTTRLSRDVERLFGIFFILQILLISALIFSTRKSEEDKRQHEILITKIARQMSHDIRSPLATLNTVLSHLDKISDENKELIERSIIRINNIANHLLIKTRIEKSNIVELEQLPQVRSTDLAKIIRDCISEKEIEYYGNKKVLINFTPSNESLYSFIDAFEMKRLISNILNNAIEASTNEVPIVINVNLSAELSHAKISIEDNGQGIPQAILNRIGKEEISSKKEGNGIGLFHAFESIALWGGNIKINSTLKKGTKIDILLPLSSPLKTMTILLDDDELVRLTWQSQAKKRNIEFEAFEKSEELLKALNTISKDSIFYVDSSLSNGEKGEDVAQILFEKGFRNIYMATGYEQEHFSHIKFLKGIRDKSPPW